MELPFSAKRANTARDPICHARHFRVFGFGNGIWRRGSPPTDASQIRLEIRSVAVGGNALPLRFGETVRLPAFPENVAFGYGAATPGFSRKSEPEIALLHPS